LQVGGQFGDGQGDHLGPPPVEASSKCKDASLTSDELNVRLRLNHVRLRVLHVNGATCGW
jgi:hypothetical protein